MINFQISKTNVYTCTHTRNYRRFSEDNRFNRRTE